MFKKRGFFPYFILLLFLAHCAGISATSLTGGSGGATGGDDGTSGTDDPADGTPVDEHTSDGLYTSGPIDVPVPIAKVEAIDPKYCTVTISSNQLTVTGQAGAVSNPTASPLVWAYESGLAQTVTTTTHADGSFDAINFTYSSPSYTAAVALAGYNGTEIGEPIFLKISAGTYVWVLTNGSSVSTSALTMNDNTVYLVLQTTSSSALTKNRSATLRQTAAVTSDLYTLNIAGVSQKLASGTFAIDQVYAAAGQPIVRSDNDFYYPDGSGGFTHCCSISGLETIAQVEVEADSSDVPWIAAITDRGLYVCSLAASECIERATFSSDEVINWFGWTTPSENWPSFSITVNTIVAANGIQTYRNYSFDTDGNSGDTTPWSSTSGGWVNKGTISHGTGSAGDPVLAVSTVDITEGSGAYTMVPNVVTSCTAGSSTKEIHQVFDSTGGTYYLLDALFNNNTNGMLCTVTNTRTLYDEEIHPSSKIVFFCAQDSGGNGQFYAYCANRVTRGVNPDGSEIVQLTDGTEHCIEDKNWKIDQETSSLVIVDATTAILPQVQFIDPATDSRLADCLE